MHIDFHKFIMGILRQYQLQVNSPKLEILEVINSGRMTYEHVCFTLSFFPNIIVDINIPYPEWQAIAVRHHYRLITRIKDIDDTVVLDCIASLNQEEIDIVLKEIPEDNEHLRMLVRLGG